MPPNPAGPRLSIVTITYRDPAGFRRTVDSLRQLEGAGIDWEHVVVESPSDAPSVKAILPPSWPLRFVSSPPLGTYRAQNLGLETSCGRVIWFLNGGDELAGAAALKRALVKIESHPVAVAYCGAVDLMRDGRFLYRQVPRDPVWKNLLGKNALCHQGVLYRREAFSRFGEYDPEYRIGADYEHHFRILAKGGEFLVGEEDIGRFDMSGASSNYRAAFREFRAIQKKHLPQLPIVLRLLNSIYFPYCYSQVATLKFLGALPFSGFLRAIWIRWKRGFGGSRG